METNSRPVFNLNDTPITALRPSTRQIIVNELNKRKVLASEEGLPRDWRGLAHLAGLPEPPGESPADQLLTAWGRQPEASLGMLEQFLGRMDRWDIIDDVHHLMRDDADVYTSGMSKCAVQQQTVDAEADSQVLTFDDIRRLEQGLEPQLYDALLLYADQDESFARLMLDRLENDYHLKVCLKDNLVGGLAFEHQGILQLISERCRRVIIILSRSFFDTPVNRFSVSFAQALAIENRRRVIIPCVYERVDMELPQEIRMLYKLDYNRATLRDYNFWERLRASVVQPPLIRPSTVAIRELNSSEYHRLKAIKPNTSETLIEPPPYTSTEMIRCKLDRLDVKDKERFKSTTALNESITLSCSTLSLSEKSKKEKSKSPSDFIRKLFKSDASKAKKKSKKLAVKL